jgi:hypothetical protein
VPARHGRDALVGAQQVKPEPLTSRHGPRPRFVRRPPGGRVGACAPSHASTSTGRRRRLARAFSMRRPISSASGRTCFSTSPH